MGPVESQESTCRSVAIGLISCHAKALRRRNRLIGSGKALCTAQPTNPGTKRHHTHRPSTQTASLALLRKNFTLRRIRIILDGMIPVRPYVLFAFAVLLWVCPLARASVPVPPHEVNVHFDNEAQSLAQGFAEAFVHLPGGAKYIAVRKGDDLVTYGSVRTARAFQGVLLVQLDSGLSYAFNANLIVSISNEKP